MATTDEQFAELREQVSELTLAVRKMTPRESVWIRPHASVGTGAKLAVGVILSANEDRPITIGARTNIYRNTEITGPVTTGEGCPINRDGCSRSRTVIGNRFFWARSFDSLRTGTRWVAHSSGLGTTLPRP